MSLLTVIVTTYCSERRWIEDLVNSLEDVAPAIELLITDNTPKSSSRILEYIGDNKNKFGKFTYVGGNSIGMFDNYRRGVNNASAPYCTFLDHDDIAHIGPIIDYLQKYESIDFLYTNEYKYTSLQNKNIKIYKPSLDILSIKYYHYPHHFSVYRTDLAKKVCEIPPGYPIGGTFDLWLLNRYFQELDPNNAKVKHLHEFCYGWRMHGASTSVDVDVNPSLRIERVNIANEIFGATGDGGIYWIDMNIGYLLRARFFNISRIKRSDGRTIKNRLDLMSSIMTNNAKIGDWSISWISRQVSYPKISTLRLLDSIPIKMVSKKNCNAVFVSSDSSTLYPQYKSDQKLQLLGVPMLLELTSPNNLNQMKEGFLLSRVVNSEITHPNDNIYAIGFGLRS